LRFTAADIFRPTVLLALALMTTIVMMILPVPAWLLDVGLALSFALAVLMFTVTLFIERPLDFSAFPTILLGSLMLRLSLNVSSTKLIISEGHTGTQAAGSVIAGVADFVMGGSVVVGLVVFLLLLIVNFIVITKGAGRMAEVGARFALDGMPGRQLAIDADMQAGAITHAEAKARRERELAETNFFGSLDGASKFVKGDALAGLLTIFLNIIVGMGVGVLGHGMPIGRAFETYTILTVGDGLVNQIPAVITSVAAALLLARGGATGSADTAVFSQLGRYPVALAAVAILLALFALVPGLPFLPFILAAAGLAAAAFAASRPRQEAPAAPAPTTPSERGLGDILDFDDIHVEFAPDLIAMVLDPATGLDARVASIRLHVATVYGLILPEIRLTDEPKLPEGNYRIRIQGVEHARDMLRPGRVLVVADEDAGGPSGEAVREPVYGAPARWIDPDQQEEAVLSGLTVVTPTEVLATHLLEVIKANLGRLLTMRTLRRLLDEFTNLSDPVRAAANRRLLDEMIPDRVPVDLLLAVLKLLLEEKVSIRNLPLILEAIAEARGSLPTPEAVCDHVRRRLGFQIVSGLKRSDGTLPILQLAPEWEEIFARYEVAADRGSPEIALPLERFNQLAESLGTQIARATATGVQPAVATSASRRRFIRSVVAARGFATPVLSYDEIGTDARPSLVGVVPA
jgi:flagellar biosynthesis protein FlhA